MDTLRQEKERKIMCGRFYVDEGTAKEIERVIRGVDLRIQKMRAGDIYPSQPAGILTCHSRQKEPLAPDLVTPNAPTFELKEMHWGFPQYQKKGLLINARAETALERRTFCDSVRHRRCIIPAKHFYEWDSDKNKVTFFREDRPVLFMAGFYNRFQNEEFVPDMKKPSGDYGNLITRWHRNSVYFVALQFILSKGSQVALLLPH